jgi:hypothetical protein
MQKIRPHALLVVPLSLIHERSPDSGSRIRMQLNAKADLSSRLIDQESAGMTCSARKEEKALTERLPYSNCPVLTFESPSCRPDISAVCKAISLPDWTRRSEWKLLLMDSGTRRKLLVMHAIIR